MKIGHIFNEVKRDNNTKAFITSQEFEVDFIENFEKGYDKNFSIKNEYDKLYYEALEPIEDKSVISKYDNEKIDKFLEKIENEVLMISGDFWGIQKFIFDGLSSKNGAKILRSRSALIQLITYAIADYISNKFVSEIVLFGAGKFLILAKPDNYEEILNSIQKSIDNYFLKNFFGQNGLIFSYQLTTKDKIKAQDSEEMKEDLLNLGKKNELKKLNKFDLSSLDDEFIIDIFNEAKKDDEICGFCNKRIAVSKNKDENVCNICNSQIKLGESLTKFDYMQIYKSKESKDIKIIDIEDISYYVKFSNDTKDLKENIFDITNKKYRGITKWPLSSFVAKNDKGIKSFKELQGNSGALMALKADIDKLGDTFREFYMTSFKKFNRLSRELEFFFANYLPYIIENNPEYNKNIYVIFAGGDDLFLIGEYKTIIKFAKDIREKFYQFSLKKATLSMGLVMFKHSTPITFVSKLADEAEARAKETKDENGNTRDGIDIFGIDMKFYEFLEIEDKWKNIVEELENKNIDTTTFYYRLIEFTKMKEEMTKNPLNAMWKSKLSYIFKRNLKGIKDEVFNEIVNLIEKYGIKIQPSIFLTIYKNRFKEQK